jgi:hypothetical protein
MAEPPNVDMAEPGGALVVDVVPSRALACEFAS